MQLGIPPAWGIQSHGVARSLQSQVLGVQSSIAFGIFIFDVLDETIRASPCFLLCSSPRFLDISEAMVKRGRLKSLEVLQGNYPCDPRVPEEKWKVRLAQSLMLGLHSPDVPSDGPLR